MHFQNLNLWGRYVYTVVTSDDRIGPPPAGRAPRTGRDGPARHPGAPHRAPHTRKPAHTRHLSRRARSPRPFASITPGLVPLAFFEVVHGVSPVSPAFVDPTQFSPFHSSFPLPRSLSFVYFASALWETTHVTRRSHGGGLGKDHSGLSALTVGIRHLRFGS